MPKLTVKHLIDNSDIPAKLVRSVIRQSGGWDIFTSHAEDIADHGIDGGFSGWIYYTETCKFFKNNRKEILTLAEQRAEEFEMGLLEMIQNFGVFRNDPISINDLAKALYQGKGDNTPTVHNVMAWYAAEEVARLYTDLLEQDK